MDQQQQEKQHKNIVTIEEAGPCKKKVLIEILPEAVQKATDEQYENLRKEAMVPGFRKGRAPRRLLEKRFGKDAGEQIKLKLLADASESALKDNEIKFLREPDIDYEKIEMPESGPLKFDFEVEVRPEFDLPALEAIPVEKQKLEVTDEQIDTEVEQLQKYSGVWVPKEDSEIESDDQIIADVTIKVQDAPEEQKLDNIEIYVRENGFVGAVPVKELDELLSGAKVGDVRKTTVEVPKTYFKEEYRGKKVDVQININDIKWLKPAELNADFIKRFGVEDETELREKIRDTLTKRLEQASREEMSGQIYKYMLDSTNFDLPLDVVADQASTLLQRQYANLLRQGLGREQIEQQMEKLRASSEQQAKEQLKTFFIMDKIAEKLDIDVTDEEVNGYIAQLAVQRGQRPERMREQMAHDGSLAQFRLEIRESKCIEKLLETAKIIEVKPKKTKKEAPKAPKKTVKRTKKTELSEKKDTKEAKKPAKKETDK